MTSTEFFQNMAMETNATLARIAAQESIKLAPGRDCSADRLAYINGKATPSNACYNGQWRGN